MDRTASLTVKEARPEKELRHSHSLTLTLTSSLVMIETFCRHFFDPPLSHSLFLTTSNPTIAHLQHDIMKITLVLLALTSLPFTVLGSPTVSCNDNEVKCNPDKKQPAIISCTSGTPYLQTCAPGEYCNYGPPVACKERWTSTGLYHNTASATDAASTIDPCSSNEVASSTEAASPTHAASPTDSDSSDDDDDAA